MLPRTPSMASFAWSSGNTYPLWRDRHRTIRGFFWPPLPLQLEQPCPRLPGSRQGSSGVKAAKAVASQTFSQVLGPSRSLHGLGERIIEAVALCVMDPNLMSAKASRPAYSQYVNTSQFHKAFCSRHPGRKVFARWHGPFCCDCSKKLGKRSVQRRALQ